MGFDLGFQVFPLFPPTSFIHFFLSHSSHDNNVFFSSSPLSEFLAYLRNKMQSDIFIVLMLIHIYAFMCII